MAGQGSNKTDTNKDGAGARWIYHTHTRNPKTIAGVKKGVSICYIR